MPPSERKVTIRVAVSGTYSSSSIIELFTYGIWNLLISRLWVRGQLGPRCTSATSHRSAKHVLGHMVAGYRLPASGARPLTSHRHLCAPWRVFSLKFSCLKRRNDVPCFSRVGFDPLR